MSINLNLLKKICETPGAPGFEQRIRKVVIDEVTPLVDSVETDNMGNVYAVKKGRANAEGKKVLVAAHMDEISFIVTHVDENGFVRFHTLGGFDPKTLTAQRVIIHGKKDLIGVMGSKPVHVMTQEERNKNPRTTDYFIDLGLPREEVDRLVTVGDPITRERELIEMGNTVSGKSLDNRVSVFILIETLRKLKDCPYDVYGVFTVQEEVGIRGARVAAHRVNPDFGLGLDTTVTYDVPGSNPHEHVTKLGEGAAVKIMDSSIICDYRMVDFLKATADKNNIKYQPEILTAGGTDTSALQQFGKNSAIAGAISVPTRYLHQTIETCHKQDIEYCIQLLTASLETMDKYHWYH